MSDLLETELDKVFRELARVHERHALCALALMQCSGEQREFLQAELLQMVKEMGELGHKMIQLLIAQSGPRKPQ
jgi:hypothetical protein